MARKKVNPVAIRLEWYREELDQTRHYFRDLPLTASVFDGQEPFTGKQQLLKAGEFFGLDLSNQAHLDLLLVILADVVFGEQKKGRPPAKKRKWDRLKLIQLAVDCNKVKEDMPKISDAKAACERRQAP